MARNRQHSDGLVLLNCGVPQRRVQRIEVLLRQTPLSCHYYTQQQALDKLEHSRAWFKVLWPKLKLPSLYHMWFFELDNRLSLPTIIREVCQLDANAGRPKRREAALLEFLKSFTFWSLYGWLPSLLCSPTSDPGRLKSLHASPESTMNSVKVCVAAISGGGFRVCSETLNTLDVCLAGTQSKVRVSCDSHDATLKYTRYTFRTGEIHIGE